MVTVKLLTGSIPHTFVESDDLHRTDGISFVNQQAHYLTPTVEGGGETAVSSDRTDDHCVVSRRYCDPSEKC